MRSVKVCQICWAEADRSKKIDGRAREDLETLYALNGTLLCLMTVGVRMPKDDPPDGCPYLTEHLVSQNAE